MATWLNGAKHPIAVATSSTKTFDLDMPVIGGAMLLRQLNNLLGCCCFCMRKDKQFEPIGRWRRNRKIHTYMGDRAA